MSAKILVVDDSAIVRQMHAFMLRSAGFEVAEAENGAEALEAALAEKFDLILTDINMPVMDGLEFLKAFRAFNKRTPFLILTTESDLGKKEVAKQLGATGWIVKPFKPQDLSNLAKRFAR